MAIQNAITPLCIIFITNSLFLCISCLVYVVDWDSHITGCGSVGYVFNISNIVACVFYGSTCICLLYPLFKRNPSENNSGGETQKNRIRSSALVVISASSLLFSMIWGITMLVALIFRFDLECLKKKQDKRDFVLIWLFLIEAIVVCSCFLISSLYIHIKIGEKQENIDNVSSINKTDIRSEQLESSSKYQISDIV